MRFTPLIFVVPIYLAFVGGLTASDGKAEECLAAEFVDRGIKTASAYLLPSTNSHEAAEDTLRGTLLRACDQQHLDQVIQDIGKSEYSPAYKKLVTDVAIWSQRLIGSSGADVYGVYTDLLIADKPMTKLTRKALLSLAAEKKHPPAMWDRVGILIERSEPSSNCMAYDLLVDLHEQGSGQAALTIARKVRHGEGVRQDRVVSSYWYVRAVENGVPETAEKEATEELESLTESQKSDLVHLLNARGPPFCPRK